MSLRGRVGLARPTPRSEEQSRSTYCSAVLTRPRSGYPRLRSTRTGLSSTFRSGTGSMRGCSTTRFLFTPTTCRVGVGRRRKGLIRASSGSESSSRMGAKQRISRAGRHSWESQTPRRRGRFSRLKQAEAAVGVGGRDSGSGHCRREARSRSCASGRWLTSPRQEARLTRQSCATPQPRRPSSGPKPRAEVALGPRGPMKRTGCRSLRLPLRRPNRPIQTSRPIQTTQPSKPLRHVRGHSEHWPRRMQLWMRRADVGEGQL